MRQASTVALAIAALVIAALVFILASVLTGPTKSPKFVLTSGTGFTITSTITAWPSCPTSPTVLLVPGVTACLTYTVQNPMTVPITVTSMSIAAVTPPPGCPTSNLDYSSATFSGSLVVPASGTNAVSVPISLIDTGTNQDSCENTTFNFAYEGTATYSEATTTVVTSSENQSGVTYTATVTASATTGQDPVPSSPTGTVTFNEGTTAICTAVPLASTGTTTSTATCGPIAASSVTAVYTNTDGNFDSSGTGS